MAGIPGFDDSELRAFSEQLREAPLKARAAVKKVVKRGALNVKKAAVDNIQGQIRPKFLPQYARHISYSLYGQGYVAEVGPNAVGQGAMGRGIEFGSVKHGPLPHLFPAWDAELDPFEKALGDAVFDPIT